MSAFVNVSPMQGIENIYNVHVILYVAVLLEFDILISIIIVYSIAEEKGESNPVLQKFLC